MQEPCNLEVDYLRFLVPKPYPSWYLGPESLYIEYLDPLGTMLYILYQIMLLARTLQTFPLAASKGSRARLKD